LISNTISFQFPNLQARDRSIIDQPRVDGTHFAGRLTELLFAGESQLSMLFTIFIFRTRLGHDENRRNSIFVREIISRQIFPLAFSLIIVHNFLADSSIPAMN
jgi:hypothetical protein